MNNELQHYGILGMKWGIRRYQNSDGTLTQEGKKRYDTLGKKISFARKKNLTVADVAADVRRMHGGKVTNEKEYEELNRISDNVSNIVYQMEKDAISEKERILSDPGVRKQIDRELHKNFGSGCDDYDLFEMVSTEIIEDKIKQNLSPKMAKLQNNLEKEYGAYQDACASITDRLVSSIQNEKLNNTKTSSYKKIIDKMIEDETRGYNPAWFVKNSFDIALWDNEVGASDFYSMDAYNKRHSK